MSRLVTVDIDVLRQELKAVIREAIARPEQLLVPLTIFHDTKLGVLEALVRYLREEKEMSFIDMSRLLGRDNKVLWRCYANAKKKSKKKPRHAQYVSIRYFINPKLTCFESITLNLKDNYGYSLKRITDLMGRNYPTVWATYNRAKKKVS